MIEEIQKELDFWKREYTVLAEQLNDIVNNSSNYEEDLIAFGELLVELREKVDNKVKEFKSEYDEALRQYKEDLEMLDNLWDGVRSEKISYEEYLEFGEDLKKRYEDLMTKYDLLNQFNNLNDIFYNGVVKQTNDKIEELWQRQVPIADEPNKIDEDLYHRMLKLIDKMKEADETRDINFEELEEELKDLREKELDEYKFRSYYQNGMESNEEDELDKIQKRIKEIEELLKKRKDIVSFEKPNEPFIWPYSKKEVETVEDDDITFGRLVKMLHNSDEEKYEYTRTDRFAYKYKNAKLWNWPKRKERAFSNIPMKFIKTTFSCAIMTGSKVISNLLMLNKDRKKKFEYANRVMEKLTDEQLEYIFKEFTNEQIEQRYRDFRYDSVMPIISEYLQKYLYKKYMSNNNSALEIYNEIVELYKKYLKEPDKESVKAEYNEKFLLLLKEYYTYKEEANKINKTGGAAFLENWESRKNRDIGGIHSGVRNSKKWRNFLDNYDDLKPHKKFKEGYGIEAAEELFAQGQFELASMEEKRTLRNRLGKTMVGPLNYSPGVVKTDYSKYTFVQDVMSTIALLGSALNMCYVAYLKKSIETANDAINALNEAIVEQNKIINQLKNLLQSSSFDTSKIASELESSVKQYIYVLHAANEYLAKTAEAGAKGTNDIWKTAGGDVYEKIDDMSHLNTDKYLQQLNSICNSSLSDAEKVGEMNKLLETITSTQVDLLNTNIGGSTMADLVNNYGNLAQAALNSGKHIESSFIAVQSIVSSTIAQNPQFFSQVCSDMLELVRQAGLLEELGTISTISSASLIPSMIAMAALIGEKGTEEQKKKAFDIIKKTGKEGKRLQKKEEDTIIEKVKNIGDNVMSLDLEKTSELKENLRQYEKAMEEWDSKSAFYRLTHKRKKPDKSDYLNGRVKYENQSLDEFDETPISDEDYEDQYEDQHEENPIVEDQHEESPIVEDQYDETEDEYIDEFEDIYSNSEGGRRR